MGFTVHFFTVSIFYKYLVKWALTEMECSVAGTTTLDREWESVRRTRKTSESTTALKTKKKKARVRIKQAKSDSYLTYGQ